MPEYNQPPMGHRNEQPPRQRNGQRPHGGRKGHQNQVNNDQRHPKPMYRHHNEAGHLLRSFIHCLLWFTLILVHNAKVFCYSRCLARHEYLLNIHRNGQQYSMNMDQKVEFYEQAPKAEKKQKKAVKKQMKAQA